MNERHENKGYFVELHEGIVTNTNIPELTIGQGCFTAEPIIESYGMKLNWEETTNDLFYSMTGAHSLEDVM